MRLKAEKRIPFPLRGIYGGVPTQLFERGKTLSDYGINAVWLRSGDVTAQSITLLKSQGARVFAEFNTLHEAAYLKEHPDAAPVGVDGRVCPPPDGWQGVCPTHPGYRAARMEAFRAVLAGHDIDGIWLDYHHSHASWEQAVPNLPDTCFCARCITHFARENKTKLPDATIPELARLLLNRHKKAWIAWRCGVFTDWVRSFRAVVDETRPRALLGTFHCPWNDLDFDGALREKLAIDLKAQAKYIDVFSPMPYHARFGQATDPAWISEKTAWLGKHLGIRGKAAERQKIWPIVQLSDWGEPVPPAQVKTVLDHGTRPPATGALVFAWSSLHGQWDKVEELGAFYRSVM